MENKFVALIVICMVLLATTHLHEVKAEDRHDIEAVDHAQCFNICKDACAKSDNPEESFCNLKCDNFCGDNVYLTPSKSTTYFTLLHTTEIYS